MVKRLRFATSDSYAKTITGMIAALTLASTAGCNSEHSRADSLVFQNVPSKAVYGCIDRDGDGFGHGCAEGNDCDDQDSAVGRECYRCTSPEMGCPCATEGKIVACGKVETKIGTEITCVQGQRTCVQGLWGDCILGPQSPGGLRPMALGSGTSRCASNPCDPYCQSFSDIPTADICSEPRVQVVGDIVCVDGGVSSSSTSGIADSGQSDGALVDGGSFFCRNQEQEAKPGNLFMYMMLDTSGSMSESMGTPPSAKLTQVKAAIRRFIESEASKGITFALQQFPNGITSDKYCKNKPYQKPENGPLLLDGAAGPNVVSLESTLNSWFPLGLTPTAHALKGAIQYTRTYVGAHADTPGVVVLATDGVPRGCWDDNDDINNKDSKKARKVAVWGNKPKKKKHLASVPTYVIGIGGSANLDTLAESGGTDHAISASNESEFLSAMHAIRGAQQACNFRLPAPPANQFYDPLQTIVKYRPASGSDQVWEYRPSVREQEDCETDSGAKFYYDNPDSPTQLFLCPNACAAANNNAGGKIIINYSCISDCSPRRVTGRYLPVDLALMVDKSGSMDSTIADSDPEVSRFEQVSSNFQAFVVDPRSKDLRVSLSYFPPGSSKTCVVDSYKTPVVPLGLLPNPNALAITGSLNSIDPSGGTPTLPALQGAVALAKTWPATDKRAVVLATDGMPTWCGLAGCGADPGRDNLAWATCVTPTIANVAADALANQIPTFVIGAGTDSVTNGLLDSIAARGGTNKAFLAADSDPTAFLDALNAIRAQAAGCDYSIPTNTILPLAPNATQVIFTPSSGTPETWTQVASRADCPATCLAGANLPAWYYERDNPSNPASAIKSIALCPLCCARLGADIEASVDLVYSCRETVTNPAPGMLIRTFDATNICPPSTSPVWAIFSWNASTPGQSRVDFEVSASLPDGTYSPYRPLVYTRLSPDPSWWTSSMEGKSVGWSDPSGNRTGLALIETTLEQAPSLPSRVNILKLKFILTPDGSSVPTLAWWDVQVSCRPLE